jgi:carbon-monoxide dehydrogenase catalytic subunit
LAERDAVFSALRSGSCLGQCGGLALGTRALDLWAADMQDVYPSIMEVAECVKTPVVTTSDSCRLPGASHLTWTVREDLESLREVGRRIVDQAVESHVKRRNVPRFVPKVSVEAEIGFSVENIAEALGGLERLAEALKRNQIRGIVSLQ